MTNNETKTTALSPVVAGDPSVEALATRDENPQALAKLEMVGQTELALFNELSEKLAASTVIPKPYWGKPADVFAAMVYGYELGMQPFASVRNIDVIDGHPALRARAAMGVCMSQRDCGGFYRSDESKRGEREVWICVRRGQEYRGEFTLADAKTAGLMNKNNWKNYPAAMLENRAIAAAARVAFPDKLAGLHTPDEIIDLRPDASGGFSAPEVPPAEVVEAEPAEPIVPDEVITLKRSIEKVTTIEQLKSFAGVCSELATRHPDYADELREAYKFQKEMIEHAAKTESGK